jgi:hypothetical protein
MVATAGAGFLSLAAMMNATAAHADDIGLVLGGSGTPIPGSDFVESAAEHYLFPTYGNAIDFYQSTPSNPFGEGLFTPEGLYPLTGVKTLPFNYPSDANGFPTDSTSVGQGDTILLNTIESDIANGNTDTVFGYSQSSVISGLVMQELTNAGIPKNDVNFLLVADETAPNGGLLSRFDGFTPSTGAPAVSDPLNLPSLGIGFDGATPSSEYATTIYTVEYDGFADFPKYPLNFLSDLNAFLGIESLHGTYLNGGNGTDGLGTGPSLADIANATQLPTSAADTDTTYEMITTLGGTDTVAGHEIVAPLVALLPTQLQELLGPDLTYLINLGYGDGSVGYSTTDADVNTPFGLSNGVSMQTELSTLETLTQQGFENLANNTDPYAAATSSGAEAATAVPAADPSITDIANAFSSALSTASSVFLPLSDISNALTTSLPAYDWSLFADNIATGDYTDAFGLPIAANTALDTLAAGFAVEVIQSAISQITADFTSIGF